MIDLSVYIDELESQVQPSEWLSQIDTLEKVNQRKEQIKNNTKFTKVIKSFIVFLLVLLSIGFVFIKAPLIEVFYFSPYLSLLIKVVMIGVFIASFSHLVVLISQRLFIHKQVRYSAEQERFLLSSINQVLQGDLSNACQLSEAFRLGKGITQCDKCAELLLAKRVKEGDNEAALKLATHYGSINEHENEFQWLKVASKMGNQEAEDRVDRHPLAYGR